MSSTLRLMFVGDLILDEPDARSFFGTWPDGKVVEQGEVGEVTNR